MFPRFGVAKVFSLSRVDGNKNIKKVLLIIAEEITSQK